MEIKNVILVAGRHYKIEHENGAVTFVSLGAKGRYATMIEKWVREGNQLQVKS